MQVGEAETVADQAELSSGVLCLCMARFAAVYATLFPAAQEVLDRSRGSSYEMWNIDASRFDQIYSAR